MAELTKSGEKFVSVFVSCVVAGIAGILVALAFDFIVSTYWGTFYSKYPHAGYSLAYMERIARPGWYDSAKGLLHAIGLFIVSGFSISLLWYRKSLYIAIPFLMGAIASFTLLAFQSPEVQNSNLGPLTPLITLIYIGPPFILGVGVGFMCRLIIKLAYKLFC